MKEFGCANLSDLSIDLMHSYIDDAALKTLFAKRLVNIKLEDETHTVELNLLIKDISNSKSKSKDRYEEETMNLLKKNVVTCLCKDTSNWISS